MELMPISREISAVLRGKSEKRMVRYIIHSPSSASFICLRLGYIPKREAAEIK